MGCYENPPLVAFPVDMLDAILDGKEDTATIEAGFVAGCYLHSILPALDWWIDISKAFSLGSHTGSAGHDRRFEKNKAKLLKLLNDALCSYTAALSETGDFSEPLSLRTPAALELLKRYRLYTRAVCATAQKIWPNVDLGWLLKQA